MSKMLAWNLALFAMAFCFALARPIMSPPTGVNLLKSVKAAGHPTTACLKSQCRFELCGNEKWLILGPSSLNPQAICLRGQEIGEILETGIPTRRDPYDDFGQPCCEDFYEFNGRFKIVSLPFGTRASGIEMSGDLAGRDPDELACFKVPILKYEKVTKKGKVKVVSTTDPEDCLSFYAFRPDIVVETEWFSADDLEMSVKTSFGYRISERKTVNQCDSGVVSSGQEICAASSTYGFDRLFSHTSCNDYEYGAKYKLRLKHTKNCLQGPTNWKMERYTQSGYPLKYVLHDTLQGTSNATSGKTITKANFTD